MQARAAALDGIRGFDQATPKRDLPALGRLHPLGARVPIHDGLDIKGIARRAWRVRLAHFAFMIAPRAPYLGT